MVMVLMVIIQVKFLYSHLSCSTFNLKGSKKQLTAQAFTDSPKTLKFVSPMCHFGEKTNSNKKEI